MKYLLDTHIILWTLSGSNKLDKHTRDIIEDTHNTIYYSTVSPWEIEIKHQKIKDFKLSGEQFVFLCDQNGLENIQIKNKHILELANLKTDKKNNHNDPFDKILLAQAISENMIFITHDKKFSYYSNKNIMIV